MVSQSNIKINYKKNEGDHFRVVQPKDGDVFLDIGAFDGVVSQKASQIAKDMKYVLIEPNPIHYTNIARNMAGLDYVIVPKAVAIDVGVQQFYIFGSDYKGGSLLHNYPFRDIDGPRDTVTVDTAPMHKILESVGNLSPDFLKIDVEGYGLQVLSTLPKLKKGTRFQIEYHMNLPAILSSCLILGIEIIELDLWEEFSGVTGAIHGVKL